MFIVNSVFLAVLYGVGRRNWTPAINCNRRMVIWVYVLASFHAFCLLLNILYILLALGSLERMRTWKPRLEFVFVGILFNFWIAWMIWGNIIIYKEAHHCKYDVGALPVFRLMLAFVVIGYLGFLIYACLACGTMMGLITKSIGQFGRRKAYESGMIPNLFNYA